MNEKDTKWIKMLRAMLADYRQKNPGDERSDEELLKSLMDHFVESGVVTKRADGKYVVPDIEGTIPLIN
jgi:hypothetical protein